MRILRRRRHQRAGLRPRSPIVISIRKPTSIHPGSRSRYYGSVSERKIDRDAWSAVVQSLIDSRTRGKKAPFARLVGVDPRTIDHWLKATVDVAEVSVRRVARATGQHPMDLLVQVGYYEAAEFTRPDTAAEEAFDEEKDLILSAPVSDQVKMKWLERLFELREQDKKRREAEIKWWIDQAKGA